MRACVCTSVSVCVTCLCLLLPHCLADPGPGALCHPPHPCVAVEKSSLPPQHSLPPSLPSDCRGAPSPDGRRRRRGGQVTACRLQVASSSCVRRRGLCSVILIPEASASLTPTRIPSPGCCVFEAPAVRTRCSAPGMGAEARFMQLFLPPFWEQVWLTEQLPQCVICLHYFLLG